MTSKIAQSYRQYRCRDIGDRGVGITPQMCNRVTNHGDMSTFSKPAYSQGAQEISLKLHLFEMTWGFIRKWTNPNIRHAVTDGPFCAQIYQGCTFDTKKENPYRHLNCLLLKC